MGEDLLEPQGLEVMYRVNELLCQRLLEPSNGDWPEDVLTYAIGLTELILFNYGPIWTDEQEAEYLMEYQ